MNFKAQPTIVSDLLSVQKTYKVARNQREFSWTDIEVNELWNDITRNIIWDNDAKILKTSEYFIGSIVLSGQEDATELIIIDGQQRITVLTILLCAIRDILIENNPEAANSINSNFIEGTRLDRSLKNIRYFKLERPTDSNFFKCKIQSLEKISEELQTPEDELLQSAYLFFLKKLNDHNLFKNFKHSNLHTGEPLSREELLHVIIDQITDKIKLVRIIVDNEDDAYVIFEILNARGKDLDSSDLVKNKLFSELRRTHPIDYAKSRWDKISDELSERSKNNSRTEFIRYWWNARHQVISQDNLFKEIKNSLDSGELTSESLLENLVESAKIYKKICDPEDIDWSKENYKFVYFPLTALKTFNVKMARPIILTLFEVFFNKKIRQADLIIALKIIEDFTFLFTAICSLRPAGVENIYSAISKKLHSSNNRTNSKLLVQELAEKLNNKKPSLDVFQAKLNNIVLTKEKTKDKPLIKYMFKRYETHLRGNYELIAHDLSIEHINPRCNTISLHGTIGNLLPLSLDTNNNLDRETFSIKIEAYKKSNYQVTKSFALMHDGKAEWTTDDIKDENIRISQLFYNDIWKIK